jgi:hypothetical protein
MFAIEFADFLAFGNEGADAGLGEKGRDTGAAGAQLFGQRALRGKFQFEFAGQILAGKFLVLADIRGNHFFDLTGCQ